MLWRASLAVLCLAPIVGAQAPAAGDAYQSLLRKIEELKHPDAPAPRGAPRQVELSEGELAAYLNGALRAKLAQNGVSAIGVKLDRDRLLGSATVDLEVLRQRLPPSASSGMLNPLSYLSGKLASEFGARLVSSNGFGTLELESVSIGPVSVPVSLVEQLVTSNTRNAENPEGIDIHAPFRLPYDIKRVRLQPGRAVIEY